MLKLKTLFPAGADVGALFRAQAEEATHSHWQIVQVAETSSPGELLPPWQSPWVWRRIIVCVHVCYWPVTCVLP